MRALDLFAGPGGWDVGADALGIRPLGVECDDAACETRRAAGLETLQADVSELDPTDFGEIDLLIGSPPCQAFSMAGKGAGRRDASTVYDVLALLASRGEFDRDYWRAKMEDVRSLLVVEPFRFALALRPRLIALEQVPPVLEVWERVCSYLRVEGYSAWCGVLASEQYGVPQTRSRAILLARLDGPVAPPSPTHQKYVPPRRELEADRLFDVGSRERIVLPGEEDLLPWVSMAEALGWGMTARPTVTVGAGGRPEGTSGGPPNLGRGSGAQEVLDRARRDGDWQVGFPRRNDVEGDDGEYRERDFRSIDEPSFGLTEKARSWEFRVGGQEKATTRDADEPAPTLAFGHDAARARFYDRRQDYENGGVRLVPEDEPAPTLTGQGLAKGRDRWVVETGNFTAVSRDEDGARSSRGSEPYSRDVDDPAPTVTGDNLRLREDPFEGEPVWPRERPAPTVVGTRRSDEGMIVGRQLLEGEGRNVGGRNWPLEAPATTVAGDPRLTSRSHHEHGEQGAKAATRAEVESGAYDGKRAVRVALEEAAVLQGFPPDYPFRGTRTARFRQVGDAVPPPLAYAILKSLTAPLDA